MSLELSGFPYGKTFFYGIALLGTRKKRTVFNLSSVSMFQCLPTELTVLSWKQLGFFRPFTEDIVDNFKVLLPNVQIFGIDMGLAVLRFFLEHVQDNILQD